MLNKVAFITGVSGQDGAYLSRLLLDKGYTVHGMLRRSSLERMDRIDDILDQITLHYGDLTDATNIFRILKDVQPDEIYNLAAQSHVGVSFNVPEYTADVDALGTLRLLEAIRILGLEHKTRFYQASTSELFGNTVINPQDEQTPFQPCSPYGSAKLYAYWLVRNYRDAYGLHASNGILFNHESPMRGTSFVTRKITKAVAAIHHGADEILKLGNLNAKRDWGHAKDYVCGMHLMIQQGEPDDYVLATGRAESIRFFVERAFHEININIEWNGEHENEHGIDANTGRVLVAVDPVFYRPNDVGYLCGDASKALKAFNWSPKVVLEDLISEMVLSDIENYMP